MSDQFAEWIKEELARLLEAWAAFEAAAGSPAAKNELHRRAHDLKGLAPTYGYPLVGRICATLCKLTGDEHGELTAPDRLLKAHVDAVKAAVLGKIKGAEHPVGLALVAELEAQTKEIIATQAAEAAAAPPKADA